MAVSLNNWGRGFWMKLVGLMLLDALALYSFLVLIESETSWWMIVMLGIGITFINWVYLWPRTEALKWITPGLVMMTIFVVIPIVFSVYVSLTNWQTGNVQSKEQTIAFFESKRYIDPEEQGELYDLWVYTDDAGEYRMLLVSEDLDYIFGEPRLQSDPPLENAVEAEGTFESTDNLPPGEFEGYRLMSQREVFALSLQLDFTNLVIDVPAGEVVILGVSQGRVVLSSQRYIYDEATDTLFDTATDQGCQPGDTTQTVGNFVCEDGTVLTLDGDGSVEARGRLDGAPTRVARLQIADGPRLIVGTATGEVAIFAP